MSIHLPWGRAAILTPKQGGPQIVTAGLVAAYRFDEGSGQVLTDYSGNGYHGQLGSTAGADTNDPTWVAGGLQADGTNDYVTIPGLGMAMPSTSITVMVVEKAPTNAIGHSLSVNNVGGNNRIGLDSRIPVYWDFGNIGAGGRLSITPSPPLAGSWYSLAATAGAGAMGLYINGVLVASTGTASTYTPTAGAGVLFADSGLTEFSAMSLGYLLVYNRILAVAEVAQNRAALKTIMAARGVTLP